MKNLIPMYIDLFNWKPHILEHSTPTSLVVHMCKERYCDIINNSRDLEKEYPEIVNRLRVNYENAIRNILLQEEWDEINKWDGENDVDWINM